MPRFQAIFGIASPAHRESAPEVVRRRTANFARRNFMEPPALGTDGFGEFVMRSLQNRYCRLDSSIWEEPFLRGPGFDCWRSASIIRRASQLGQCTLARGRIQIAETL